MVRPLFIPAFWPRPHPFQVQIVPVRDISQLLWLLYVAVTSPKFPRTAMMQTEPKPPGMTSQRWMTFVRNHAKAIIACDFFIVVTATFRLVYVFVIMEVGRRRTSIFVSEINRTIIGSVFESPFP